MTKDEILNMSAGDEFDLLIAKEFNLFTRQPREGDKYDKNGTRLFYRKYSSDIKAAWEVVEKFYSMTLEKFSAGAEWRAYLVTSRDNKNVDASAVADTAPLAICRAALLAVMEVQDG